MDMSHLFRIFQGIVNCLCSIGASNFKTRCSLYGAILYYMQIGKLHTSVREKGLYEIQVLFPDSQLEYCCFMFVSINMFAL